MKDKICFKIYAYETVEIKEKLGVPNKDEIINSHVKFDISSNDDKNKNNKGEIKNKLTRSMTRFNTSGNLRKTMTKSSKSIKTIKDKDCLIF